MKDEIFWENLLKIIRRGSWTMTGEELLVFAEVYRITLQKSKPPMTTIPVNNPLEVIKNINKAKKGKETK